MLLGEALTGVRVFIKGVHPESSGQYEPGCTGCIAQIESDGAVWVKFDEGQVGVPDTAFPIYVGDMKDFDTKFEILDL